MQRIVGWLTYTKFNNFGGSTRRIEDSFHGILTKLNNRQDSPRNMKIQFGRMLNSWYLKTWQLQINPLLFSEVLIPIEKYLSTLTLLIMLGLKYCYNTIRSILYIPNHTILKSTTLSNVVVKSTTQSLSQFLKLQMIGGCTANRLYYLSSYLLNIRAWTDLWQRNFTTDNVLRGLNRFCTVMIESYSCKNSRVGKLME